MICVLLGWWWLVKTAANQETVMRCWIPCGGGGWVCGFFFPLFFAKGKFRGEEDDKEDNNFVVHSLLWCGLEEGKESEREREMDPRALWKTKTCCPRRVSCEMRGLRAFVLQRRNECLHDSFVLFFFQKGNFSLEEFSLFQWGFSNFILFYFIFLHPILFSFHKSWI